MFDPHFSLNEGEFTPRRNHGAWESNALLPMTLQTAPRGSGGKLGSPSNTLRESVTFLARQADAARLLSVVMIHQERPGACHKPWF